MTNNGDDCYFFYYSTCTKGDSCPFRHCEAAMGSETVCNLWQEGRCFRAICKFRHMEITKKRKEIPCYWENQLAGCQKPHCAFFHERPRCIDGVFVPPDKSQSKNEEQPHEEPAPPPPAPLPTAANPQLRSVIKTETQEPVPSPTHPPVVINPADDDEDEDDQFSEEGDVGPSPRKPKSDDSLNFGVSTLEEIRLRKALKASMKRAGYPIHSPDTSTNGEKENIQSLFRPPLYEARDGPLVFEETARPRGSLAERLGRKIPATDVISGEGFPLRRGLAGRLGRVVGEDDPLMPPQKALKPIKDRLGLPRSFTPTPSAETNMESKKAPEQIRIKTLEEIRQEKAAKSQHQSQKDVPTVVAPETNNKTQITKAVKRAITIKEVSIDHVKTFSEILHAKKKRQEEQEQKPSAKKAKHTVEKAPGKGESDTAGPDPEASNIGEVKVKTLEEIRREKAAKIQAQQALKAENKKSSDNEENSVKKPRLLRIKKPASQSNVTDGGKPQRSTETEKPLKTTETSAATSNNVKVKTFEEIMREKRLRKQEMEEQAMGSAEEEPSEKQTSGGALKRKAPAKISLTCLGSSSPSSTTLAPDSTPSTQKLSVGKLIPLKTKAASPLNNTTSGTRGAAVRAVTSVPVKLCSSSLDVEPESDSQSPSSSREVPDKNTRNSIALSPDKQARAAPQVPGAEALTSDKTLNNNQKKSPEPTADTKVRPKLNVKPSVVKVKPGQKRKGAERSAVAAVKPLNTTSTALKEPLQETTHTDRQEFPSSSAEAQLSSAVPRSPSTLLDSGSSSSPLREELQTVPVFKQSLSQEAKQTVSVAAAREACTVPQSSVLKSPTQPKSRRLSVAASRSTSTSAVDEFEELISEFTDDHLEGDVDPGIGEDDLLQELSEMIDS
uniref:zinc finger CCCH domain-containing protein 11A n=1 Tax=Epinephelus lanceolatus TaxID=310571 RepID=UPI001444B1FA|nr:zinc finger CCCH domain-containing protein 11A [Epinephelus lanceolatus]XP_033482485.1 zinc finger CCCH domain-containing protein 11A [Epinephelus lanceolatus]XP_033482486.1 zinc finger CCCH domain-containing protein 11A [Epinephelus lanceolatus]XP_033482487.1 zinc finger CCCH domain-containing protein 11A [Epinephelus lanceolatus]XP_033482488.1 zinc finger CCCH domain-containing protein 11A [Epinephelus lanceolatus]XP_033482489.1 zinc finger CCCH domain-containing protein 11A [Epinephelus 